MKVDKSSWADDFKVEWVDEYYKDQSDKRRKPSSNSNKTLSVVLTYIGVFAVIAVASVVGVYNVNDCKLFHAFAEEDTDKLRNELSDVRQNKQTAEELYKEFAKSEKDMVKYIKKLDKKSGQLEDDLINMQQQQDGIAENLERVEAQLEDDKRVEAVQYSAMKLRVKYLYEHGSYTFMDALAGSTSFGDMLNRTALASKIQEYDKNVLQEYRDSLNAISEKEQYISTRKEHLEKLTRNLEDEREAVELLDKAKKLNLMKLKKNLSSFNNLLDFYKKSEADLESQIVAAETEVYDDFEDIPVKYTGDKLLWPVPGHYKISSYFGSRMHPILHYRRLHAGIDISCPTGAGIYAAAAGKVIIATYDSGAGNYVMLDHGDGLCTVYMHNSKLLVKVGQTVKKGQKLALAGSTGLSTGSHCHFGVRVHGTYVNPLKYFKSTESAEETDYTEDDVRDTDKESNSPKQTKEKSKDEGMSKYKKEADDQGDNGKKSSELQDDGDADSE